MMVIIQITFNRSTRPYRSYRWTMTILWQKPAPQIRLLYIVPNYQSDFMTCLHRNYLSIHLELWQAKFTLSLALLRQEILNNHHWFDINKNLWICYPYEPCTWIPRALNLHHPSMKCSRRWGTVHRAPSTSWRSFRLLLNPGMVVPQQLLPQDMDKPVQQALHQSEIKFSASVISK